ncbi:hypothetical protein K9B35_07740 [Sphingomonas sp. R647]|uniref:HNH endonuclease n=1 Tax=Sphingomonas sp. R647 TaxID=2875233 RepID=UPI001CD3B06F|nr:hypothetical protein [Sphingomonas sp. R647]MCA1197855.1 hypothetical protein [Sphingomonas sp. R647]
MMQAITYSAAEKAIVDAFNALPFNDKKASYWSDDVTKATRDAIKDFYILEQDYRCCYCRRKVLSKNKGDWQGDHVIARDTHAQFMFEPKNLAICCRGCNGEKSNKNVLRNAKRKTFPVNSDDYLIVHPHMDDYDDHIRWFGQVCAPRKSNKGAKTIEMCGLMRFAADYAGLDTDMNDRRFDELVGQLMTTNSKLEGASILAGLKVYIDNLAN